MLFINLPTYICITLLYFHVLVCLRVWVGGWVHVSMFCLWVWVYVHVLACACLCVCMCVCVYACVSVFVF